MVERVSITEKAIVLSMVGEFNPAKLPGSTIKLWRLVSKALLLRAEGHCETCGKHHQKLHVHHRDGCGLNNSPDNLVVLCDSCHKKKHIPPYHWPGIPTVIASGATGQSTKGRTLQINNNRK
ncbi:MAG: HNH endonuclease signature motif containing protein [Dehalococcoidia bacterium]|jgi:hypothetical protein